MIGDDQTISESARRDLVRAAFVDSDDARHTVRSNLSAADPRRRVLALRAGNRQSWLSVEDLLAAHRDVDANVRREFAQIATTFTPAHQLLGALAALLGDDDDLVVEAAAFALGELGARESVGALIDVARDHLDARCRESAVAALGCIGDDAARTTIINALNDKAPVRRRAVVALTNFTGPDIDAALASAREDRDWQVRAAVDQLDREPWES